MQAERLVGEIFENFGAQKLSRKELMEMVQIIREEGSYEIKEET